MLTTQEIDFVDTILDRTKSRIDRVDHISKSKDDAYKKLDSCFILQKYNYVLSHIALSVNDSKDYNRILVVKIHYSLPNNNFNSGGYELQLIGLKKLDKDYGHILIRPETIEDKVIELLVKSEIDFKDFPKFSSKYYFLSKNKKMANSFATNKRLESIENQREILIEIKGNILIARYSRVLNYDDMNSMIDFIQQI